MACRACDHTMQSIVPGVFWCPRCGAVKREYETLDPEWYEPKIVHRAFTLCEKVLDSQAAIDDSPDALKKAEAAVRECCLPARDR